MIDVSMVKPYPKGDEKGWPGWKFPKTDDEYPNAALDKLFGSEYLHEIYYRADKSYQGRFSVPVLWDTKTNTILNNESLEILRLSETAFDSLLPEEYKALNFYPEHLRHKIDEIGNWMQSKLNFGVYKAGYAPNQEAYDKNARYLLDEKFRTVAF
jgi:glutathionyl-hydroquinone reductase